MNSAEHIYREVLSLSEDQALRVLDFVAHFKTRNGEGSQEQDIAVFDQFGAVYDGTFSREESHARIASSPLE